MGPGGWVLELELRQFGLASLFFISSECALQIMGSKVEFHGWQLLIGQAN